MSFVIYGKKEIFLPLWIEHSTSIAHVNQAFYETIVLMNY